MWNPIQQEEQVRQIAELSHKAPQVIFKHSTRCSISSVAKNRLEKAGVPTGVQFHYLDLIAHRPVSNFIARFFGVNHESPQVLLIREGRCVYDESHMGISMDAIEEQLN
ncbi:MAG TPA: bacillithiol system redox-active protein YtxJ [Lacibacter sp.]|nr:bacillithiol system redox-active protein YtxJ [Lacibacter sp.]HMO89650.1 bacillithiol system redox-active protein YtxJ [Lacibacter sp.]HMP86826.1 bacillithiol system redox-active protein YtxJ [Lacibacter sp.]